MKKIILILLFLLQTVLFAQSAVWKIQKEDDVIYLGGTIHLLRSKDYPLPKEYEMAYKNSHTIYFETNLKKLEDPNLQKEMISAMVLKKGKKLSTVLSTKTYNALKKHAQSRGVDILHFENFKPAMIILTLTVIELKNMGIDAQGVDSFYFKKALNDNKQLGQLESVESHINYLSTMGEGNENNLVIQSLKDLKKSKKYFSRIISAWKNGSIGALNRLFVTDMKKNTPKLYQSLLVERNNNWMPILESLFGNEKTEFILVGAAHLVGQHGLLQQLKREGYTVQKYK